MEYNIVTVGNRAYEARKNKNLKQKAVSSKLGIHQATYSKFELGQHDLRGAQLVKLCEILDISIFWLLGEDIISDLNDNERLIVDNFIKFIKTLRK